MSKEIKFKVQLSTDQKEGKSRMLPAKISVVIGKAGSGKTLLTANVALQLLFQEQIDRIVISRPTVQDKDADDLGFTPGDLDQKMMPFVSPIIDNMYKLYDKNKIDELIKEGKIVIKTLQHIKGTTIDKELLIVDEIEDATQSQILKVLTRIGKDYQGSHPKDTKVSKIIFCGDLAQCDFQNPDKSGILKLIQVAKSLDYMEFVELTTNHRDPIVEQLINSFK
jgi:phosphate starvation-inducible protein PhoH and related proteins